MQGSYPDSSMNHDETALSRARRDTNQAAHSWRWRAVGVGASVAATAITLPLTATALSTVELLGVALALVVTGPAATIVAAFAWASVRAPYRQRDEARSEIRMRQANSTVAPAVLHTLRIDAELSGTSLNRPDAGPRLGYVRFGRIRISNEGRTAPLTQFRASAFAVLGGESRRLPPGLFDTSEAEPFRAHLGHSWPDDVNLQPNGKPLWILVFRYDVQDHTVYAYDESFQVQPFLPGAHEVNVHVAWQGGSHDFCVEVEVPGDAPPTLALCGADTIV